MYDIKLTEKREQYDWRAEKNLDGLRDSTDGFGISFSKAVLANVLVKKIDTL